MKKMNNKGFSLVELIIVIAIMAILAGAIAPALIRYIDKSRKSNDVSSGKTIKTAVETAMGNETTYELLTNNGSGTVLTINPNASSATAAISGVPTDANNASAKTDAETEIFNNIGEKTPKIKYKKNGADHFYVQISDKGTVRVWIGKTAPTTSTSGTSAGSSWQLTPDLDKEYQ